MPNEYHSILAEALAKPGQLTQLRARDWDVLIRQGRHANLLARLHARIADAGAIDSVPEAPRRHLIAAHHLAERQHNGVRQEADALCRALRPEGIDVILLKGAAYVLAGLPAAQGRVFADVDILVPKAMLPQAESALMRQGWVTTHLNDYDQRYYRRWMHELPPMQHMFRGSALDVHHAILPPTARYHPDPASLVAESTAVAGWDGVRVLSAVDMVLHSATHLFHEGEADNALRDLSDLDLLLRHFGVLEGDAFWSRLRRRAEQQQLTHPLWLALRYTERVFGTPVLAGQVSESAPESPRSLRLSALDAMYSRIFLPQHKTCDDAWTPLARKALYVRGHWLRMPPHLLFMHLARKAVMRDEKPDTEDADQTKRAALRGP